MDFFTSSIAHFVNNIQQANHTPAPTPATQQPKTNQGSTIDFSGGNADKKNNRSGGMDSLGSGNVI